MNDTIKIELNLPEIGGTLVAFLELDWEKMREDFKEQFPEFADKITFRSSDEYKAFEERESHKYYRPDWRLLFEYVSSDARYNSAFALVWGEQDKWLSRSTFKAFYEAFEESLKKMKILVTQNFQGTYSKYIGEINKPAFKVVAEDNKVYLGFILSSSTTSFTQRLDIKTTEEIIEKLKDIPEKALELMISLEELTS